MAKLTMIIVFLTVGGVSLGQPTFGQTARLMSYDDNLRWLKDIRTRVRSEQWLAVTQRFFSDVVVKDSSASYCPMIVVNGVALNFPDRIRDADREKMKALLAFNKLKDIQILDTLSAELIVCKPFAGVILILLDDRANKKMRRLIGAMSK